MQALSGLIETLVFLVSDTALVSFKEKKKSLVKEMYFKTYSELSRTDFSVILNQFPESCHPIFSALKFFENLFKKGICI